MTEKDHLIEHWPNGNKKREGFYRASSSSRTPNDKEGAWASWYENGKDKAQVSHDGFISCRNGPARSWYENGQIETEIEFTNGHINGYVSIWYDDGQKALEGHYIGGEMTGEWKTWYQSGQLQYQGFFYSLLSHDSYFHDDLHTWESVKEDIWNWDDESSDEPIDDEQEESWHGQSPDFWWDDDFLEGGKEGAWTEWYENGQKKSETIYKNYDDYQTDVFQHYLPSEKEGLATEWYESSQKKSEGYYLENCKISEFLEWHESGEIKSITHYLNWGDYPEPYDDNWNEEEAKDGKCIVFHENGEIKLEEYYIKGKLYESNEYPLNEG